MKRALRVVTAAAAAALFVAPFVLAQSETAQDGPPPPPPARAVPGLTAPDPHPNGCVDCHIRMKQPDLDARLSTQMQMWMEGAEPRVLAAAKAAAADSTKITGKHPKTTVVGKDVPKSCLICHGRESSKAPPFARMIHLIHLTGGDANHFMGIYQGECTHCHKLNAQTGAWSVPNGQEKPAD